MTPRSEIIVRHYVDEVDIPVTMPNKETNFNWFSELRNKHVKGKFLLLIAARILESLKFVHKLFKLYVRICVYKISFLN